MNALEKYITLHEQLLSDNIKLSSFDNHYYNTLPKEDKELILIDLKKGKYHTILLNSSIKVGVIGYIPTKMDPKIGFLQIIIDPKYRSKGIFSKSIKLLAKEHNLKEVWSTIKKDNIVSIKAHLKDGFKQFSEDKLEQWREVYLLDPDEVRLYKKFSNKEQIID